MNVLSKASRKLARSFCFACAASVGSSTQVSSNWSKSSWSASVEVQAEPLVEDLDDLREVLGLRLVLRASPVEDRAHLALAVVERDRSLERLLEAEVGQLDLAAEVEAALASSRAAASRARAQ